MGPVVMDLSSMHAHVRLKHRFCAAYFTRESLRGNFTCKPLYLPLLKLALVFAELLQQSNWSFLQRIPFLSERLAYIYTHCRLRP